MSANNGDAWLAYMMAHPLKARAELEFVEFAKQAWPQLEPGVEFVVGRSVEAICEHLQAVTMGEITRLLINVPPGFTKSMLTNVLWPAWEWGPCGMPATRYVSASYEQGLSTRDLVRARDLIKSEWYQERWPIAFKADQDAKTFYENTGTGWRFAASVRAALTGYRGDRIIIDDPHSVKGAESDAEREESLRWFAETIPTRLNKPSESAIVVIMQRLHQRDISGLILDELGKDWVHMCLPMEYERERHCTTRVKMRDGTPFTDWRTTEGELLEERRYDREAVDQLKKQLRSHGGSYAEAGQLQQRPAPREGGMFKPALIRILDAPRQAAVVRVRGWDFAATSKKQNPRAAWTAGVKLAIYTDGLICVEDVVRIQGDAGEVKELLVATAHRDGRGVRQDIPQDPGQAGKGQVLDFARALQGFEVFASPETGEKKQRAQPLSAQCSMGNLAMVRAVWNDQFIAELQLFPGSTYMDQVDATSRAYSAAVSMQPQAGDGYAAPTLMQRR